MLASLFMVGILCGGVVEGATRGRPETRRPRANPFDDVDVALGIAAGAFAGGGFNRGPSAAATVTLAPAFPGRRFALDIELGWRMAAFSSPVEGYGQLTSSMHAFPLAPALRFTALRTGWGALDVRAGIGALFLLHHLSSDYDAPSTRFAAGWEAFVGAQLRVPVTRELEVALDARAGLGEAHVSRVLGRALGAQGHLGLRYALP